MYAEMNNKTSSRDFFEIWKMCQCDIVKHHFFLRKFFIIFNIVFKKFATYDEGMLRLV